MQSWSWDPSHCWTELQVHARDTDVHVSISMPAWPNDPESLHPHGLIKVALF